MSSAQVAVLPERSARACKECSRRKTSCDRNVPCGACVKRGAAAACSSAPSKRRKVANAPSHEISARQSAALDELRLFRTTLDSLRARLPGLEHFVANAQLKEDDSAELDGYVAAFGDPTTDLSALREEEGGEGSSSRAGPSTSRRTTSNGPTSAAGNGTDERQAKKARLVEPKREEEQSGSNVEAAVSLEFYTLGRPRAWAEAANVTGPAGDGESDGASDNGPDAPPSPSHALAILPPVTFASSPLSRFPDGRSLEAVDPGIEAETVLLEVGLDLFGFHHSVVHAPTFRSQLSAFRHLGDDAFQQASPAWLSLYFAILAVSAKLVSREQTAELDWTDEKMQKSASEWFECSVACLYRSNFLQIHDFFALQTIALLVLSGRDAGSASLIASLLYSGLSIAQDMGLHRLLPDAQWDAALKGRPARIRGKNLIEREYRKRVFWALICSEAFAVPFRGASTMAKVLQIATTPLPLNANDEDLAKGELVDRPRDEFTIASWLLRYVEIGNLMSKAFDHTTTEKATAAQAYHAFLETDKQLDALMNDIPAWLRENGDGKGIPDTIVETVRSTFRISLHHKILSVHRPFLAKPSRATTYAFSRRRVMESARAILREAPLVRSHEIRIWTAIYHLSVALFSLVLALYENLKNPTGDEDAIREEIRAALPTLEALKDVSAIAERGLGLVLPLLADEQKMRIEAGSVKEKKKKSTSKSALSASNSTSSTSQPSPSFPSHPGGTPTALSADLSTSPFANAYNPSPLPDGAHLPFPYPSPSLPGSGGGGGAEYDPAHPGAALSHAHPYSHPHSYPGGGGGATQFPPWLYGEHLYSQLSGLDGSGGAFPPPHPHHNPASSSAAPMHSGFPAPYGYHPGFGGVSAPMPQWGVGGGAGMMPPPSMPQGGAGAGGYGALGWDWAAMPMPFPSPGVGGGGVGWGGEEGEEGESPMREGEGEGA